MLRGDERLGLGGSLVSLTTTVEVNPALPCTSLPPRPQTPYTPFSPPKQELKSHTINPRRLIDILHILSQTIYSTRRAPEITRQFMPFVNPATLQDTAAALEH